MVRNNFEGYIGLFLYYIIFINYTTFMDQILIFGPSSSKIQLSLIFNLRKVTFVKYLRPCGADFLFKL